MSYPEPMPIFFGPGDRQQLAAALLACIDALT
jgi:hypothetical protein